MRVLIIDDDKCLAYALASALKQVGYDVHVASNGAAGLAHIRHHHPDLILCDIIMPIMNGLQVRKSIQNEPELANIPFIFMSGRDQPDDIAIALGLGAKEYLVKPVNIQTFLDSVQHYLGEPCAE